MNFFEKSNAALMKAARRAGRGLHRFLAALALLAVLLPIQVQACSVCYGEPDSPAARGLTWAIVALGLVVGMVISGVVVFFVQANRNPMQSDLNESIDTIGKVS